MPRTPKILMLGWELPPYNSGGLGVACEGLTRALSARDIQITFLLPFAGKRAQPDFMDVRPMVSSGSLDAEMIKRYALLFSSPYMTAEQFEELKHKLPAPNLYGGSLFKLVDLFADFAVKESEKIDFDIIHAHDWLTYQAGIRIKEKTGKPLVVHVHATEFDRTGDNPNPHISDIEYHGVTAADVVMPVSNFTKFIVARRYAVPLEKMVAIHNGFMPVGSARQLPAAIGKLRAQGNHMVLFVGRLTIQKGPEYFLYMAKRVLQYQPKTYFIVSGSGDMEHQMMRLAAEMGISAHVLFAGFLRGDELAQIYAASDVYVMPSVSEPFGITALEAADAGAALVLSKQSGAREVIGGAFTADFWDTDEMANLIINILRSPGLRRTLRDQAREDAARATWELAAQKVSDIYRKLMFK